MDDGAECTLCNFTDTTNLGGLADNTRGLCCHPEEPWQPGEPDRNLMNFNKILHLGNNNPMHQYSLGLTIWKAALQKRYWRCCWTLCEHEAEVCPCSKCLQSPGLYYEGQCQQVKEGDYLHSSQHRTRHIWSAWSSSGLPRIRDMDLLQQV